MKKEQLRAKYLCRRQGMHTSIYHQQSQQVHACFFRQFNMAHYTYLHTYLSCPVRQEVDTWSLVHTILGKHPEVMLASPKLLDRAGYMESYAIDQETTFQQHPWGIQEPKNGTKMPAAAFVLVVLPVIAFDVRGYRVGYGQGYYDRFLKQCRPNVVKVGLCFENPVTVIEDHNTYDVPMDYCITPNQVFRWQHQDTRLSVGVHS